MGIDSKGSKSRMVVSDINVTPLVDVMLVLLIMFMVTAPLMQQGIDVDLPKTKASGVEIKEEPLILIIDAKENLKIAKAEISIKDLASKLKSIASLKKNSPVYIQADKKVSYGFVAEIMAEIRAAGIFNIGLITAPKDAIEIK